MTLWARGLLRPARARHAMRFGRAGAEGSPLYDQKGERAVSCTIQREGGQSRGGPSNYKG